jgi:CSLREA domain-containing protein
MTFAVTTTADEVNPSDGLLSLREAVIAANMNPGADTITLGAGFYLLTIPGTGETQSATGDLNILDDVTITGAGAGVTIIDGGKLDRVFDILGPRTVNFQGVTIQDGLTAGSGGGIFVENAGATVTVQNCIVQGNTVAVNGGGIAVADPTSTLTLNSSAVSGNFAAGVRSGGTLTNGEGGGVFSLGTVTITNSSGVNNNVAGGSGGGIHAEGATLTVQSSLVNGNISGDQGGGIFYQNTSGSATGTLSLSGDTFTGDKSSLNGGAVCDTAGTSDFAGRQASPSTALTIDQCSFLDDTAGDSGGGVYLTGNFTVAATAMVASTTFDHDFGSQGGGMFLDQVTSLTIDQCTFTDNKSSYDGGGFQVNARNNATPPTVTVTGSTFTGNSGSSGGGMFIGGSASLTIDQCTITDNRATYEGAGVDFDVFTGTGSGTFALTNSTLSSNTAGEQGGAVYCNFESFTSGSMVVLTFTNDTIAGNSSGEQGGGLLIQDILAPQLGSSTDNTSFSSADRGLQTITGGTIGLTMSGCFVTDNTAAQAGGGIFLIVNQTFQGMSNQATVNISTSTISRNTSAAEGGGIYYYIAATNADGTPNATLTLDSDTVTSNRAGADGAGISRTGTPNFVLTGAPDASLTVHDCTVSANTTPGSGGGLITDSGNVTIDGSTFSGDTVAVNGGGLSFNTTGLISITNTTISGNVANNEGGGIFLNNPAAPGIAPGMLMVIQDTLNGNSANLVPGPGGGGIFNNTGGTVTLQNTIVANSPNGSNFAGGGTYVDLKNNLSSDNSGAAFLTDASDFNNTDPMLGPLQNNGGATFTQALLPGSPAIDMGLTGVTTTDQRGVTRPVGAASDIGAYEFIPGTQIYVSTIPTPIASTTFPQVQVFDALTHTLKFTITPYPGFAGDVRVAVADVNGDGVPDIITGAGPMGGPHVKVFSGVDGSVLMSFMAFVNTDGSLFFGGVYVAAGQFGNSNVDDLVVSQDAGGSPNVKLFSGADGHLIDSFMAYAPVFTGGVRVAVADVSGDARDDIITGAGPGGGPHIEVFDGLRVQEQEAAYPDALDGFFAFNDPAYHGGVYVAAGELGTDLNAEIIAGKGDGPAETVGGNPVDLEVVDGLSLAGQFLNVYPGFDGGVRVGTLMDVNGDNRSEIITGAGMGGGAQVNILDGTTDAVLFSDLAYPQVPSLGTFVGGH